MGDIALEPVAESLTLVVEFALAVVLTIIGLAAESAGLARIGAGLDTLTIWYAAIGALTLYAGVYLLGYQTVLPQLRS